MGYNPSKSTWLNPDIEYLFNNEIIEYDIRDAGFSLIKQFKLLPDDKIRELTSIDKGFERHRAIGMLQRNNSELSKSLSDKFTEIRTIFIGANKLSDNNIISVKKDAIYTIGPCSKLKFGSIIFIAKNSYTSYIRFPNVNNIEIYYSSGTMDIKGIGDVSLNKHRLYMMEFLRRTISMLELKDIRIKRWITNFIADYKSGNLDDGFYLEFNNLSKDINPIYNYQNIVVPMVQIILREME